MKILKSIVLSSALVMAATSALASEGSYNKSSAEGSSSKFFSAFDGSKPLYLKAAVGLARSHANYSDGLDEKFRAKFENMAVVGFGFGTELNENFRTELMFNFNTEATSNVKKVASGNGMEYDLKLSIFNPTLQGYYQFSTGSQFKPYVMAGIGIAKSHLKYNMIDVTNGNYTPSKGKASKSSLSYTAGLGVSYDYNKNISLDLGYRYNIIARAPHGSYINNAASIKYNLKSLRSHVAEFGVRVKI